MRKINFLIPTTKPVGGIIKMFDYICHTNELGYDYELYFNHPPNMNSPLFDNKRYKNLKNKSLKRYKDLSYHEKDMYFFSWPEDFTFIQKFMENTYNYRQIIHIVQNVRHSNPGFCHGYALKLLSYPINRIILGDITFDAVKKFLPPFGVNKMIEIGHDLDFFYKKDNNDLDSLRTPIKVAYTTWKSDIGKNVQHEFKNDNRFTFKYIDKTCTLSELRDLYHWCDVFLGCPNEEEGTYMPGLEALASGATLIMPNVGGNMVYCTNNASVIIVNFEDVSSYVNAMYIYAENREEHTSQLLLSNTDQYAYFDIKMEKSKFNRYISTLRSQNI